MMNKELYHMVVRGQAVKLQVSNVINILTEAVNVGLTCLKAQWVHLSHQLPNTGIKQTSQRKQGRH